MRRNAHTEGEKEATRAMCPQVSSDGGGGGGAETEGGHAEGWKRGRGKWGRRREGEWGGEEEEKNKVRNMKTRAGNRS